MDARSMAFLFGVLGFVWGLIALLTARKGDALERRRLDVLEKALAHPALDDATRAELLRAVAREHGAAPLSRRLMPAGRAVWYGIGWMLFVVGGCMLVAHSTGLLSVDLQFFVPATIAGFAALTLPMALGELARRSTASTAMR